MKSVGELKIEQQLHDIDASYQVKVIDAVLDSSLLCAVVAFDAYKTLLPSSQNNSAFMHHD